MLCPLLPSPAVSTVSSPGAPDPSASAASPPPADFAVGDGVRLALRPAYLKTADPMPMLRPPDLIGEEETGRVVELRSLDQLAVRFRRGTFLLSATQLRRSGTDQEQG